MRYVVLLVSFCACAPVAPPADPASQERACAEKRLPSCVSLAYAYTTGTGVPKDPAHGATLYERACKGGLTVGCVNLGVAFALGSGVPQDRATAARHFRAACEDGPETDASVPVACVNLGVLVDGGLADANGQSSQTLFERACRAHYPTACRYAGLALIPTEPARAEDFLNLACQRGDGEACTLLDRKRAGDPVEFDETILFAKVNYHY